MKKTSRRYGLLSMALWFILLFTVLGCAKAVTDGKNITDTIPATVEAPSAEKTPENIPPVPEVPAPTPEPVPKPKTGENHYVNLIDGGFEKGKEVITIKAGDTVIWQNVREKIQFNKGMIIGTQKCSSIKSPIFPPGDSFKWTFSEPMTCVIVDGIYTTQTMKVIIG